MAATRTEMSIESRANANTAARTDSLSSAGSRPANAVNTLRCCEVSPCCKASTMAAEKIAVAVDD